MLRVWWPPEDWNNWLETITFYPICSLKSVSSHSLQQSGWYYTRSTIPINLLVIMEIQGAIKVKCGACMAKWPWYVSEGYALLVGKPWWNSSSGHNVFCNDDLGWVQINSEATRISALLSCHGKDPNWFLLRIMRTLFPNSFRLSWDFLFKSDNLLFSQEYNFTVFEKISLEFYRNYLKLQECIHT